MANALKLGGPLTIRFDPAIAWMDSLTGNCERQLGGGYAASQTCPTRSAILILSDTSEGQFLPPLLHLQMGQAVPLLLDDPAGLADLGITSKQRLSRAGRTSGGRVFSRGALYLLLRNATYIGKTRHKGEMHEGQHQAIVARETWDQAQALLDERGGPQSAPRRSARRVFDGRLHDSHGRRMRTTCAQRTVASGTARVIKRYGYYVTERSGDISAPPAERVPAEALEIAVRDALRTYLCDRAWLADRLQQAGAGAAGLAAMLERLQQGVERLIEGSVNDSGTETAWGALIRRIDLFGDSLRITLNVDDLAQTDQPADSQPLDPVTLEVPFTRHQKGRSRPMVLHTTATPPRRDPELIALVADARRWWAELLSGRASTIEDLTRREGLPNGAISRLLPLAFLAPDIAGAILDGRSPPTLSAKRLRDLETLPLAWSEQRQLLGFG